MSFTYAVRGPQRETPSKPMQSRPGCQVPRRSRDFNGHPGQTNRGGLWEGRQVPVDSSEMLSVLVIFAISGRAFLANGSATLLSLGLLQRLPSRP